ncbi:MAG: hypothetical protein F6K26_34195, partial [Moorea sp. SIO2I5]|nr:hypothetical protein [Moorena sp. SIO2I5]
FVYAYANPAANPQHKISIALRARQEAKGKRQKFTIKIYYSHLPPHPRFPIPDSRLPTPYTLHPTGGALRCGLSKHWLRG